MQLEEVHFTDKRIGVETVGSMKNTPRSTTSSVLVAVNPAGPGLLLLGTHLSRRSALQTVLRDTTSPVSSSRKISDFGS